MFWVYHDGKDYRANSRQELLSVLQSRKCFHSRHLASFVINLEYTGCPKGYKYILCYIVANTLDIGHYYGYNCETGTLVLVLWSESI